jgi:hypothetical protein
MTKEGRQTLGSAQAWRGTVNGIEGDETFL